MKSRHIIFDGNTSVIKASFYRETEAILSGKTLNEGDRAERVAAYIEMIRGGKDPKTEDSIEKIMDFINKTREEDGF